MIGMKLDLGIEPGVKSHKPQLGIFFAELLVSILLQATANIALEGLI